MSLLLDRISGMANLPDIIKSCKNQREIVDRLMEYSPAKDNTGTLPFTNPGILHDKALDDQPSLETSIYLALSQYRNTEALVLLASEVDFKTRKAVVPGSIAETSKKSLAAFLAKEITGDPRAIGFSLTFRYNREKQPNGYDVTIYQAPVTRAELRTQGTEECAALIAIAEQKFKERLSTEPHLYSRFGKEVDQIKAASKTWSPKYIATVAP